MLQQELILPWRLAFHPRFELPIFSASAVVQTAKCEVFLEERLAARAMEHCCLKAQIASVDRMVAVIYLYHLSCLILVSISSICSALSSLWGFTSRSYILVSSLDGSLTIIHPGGIIEQLQQHNFARHHCCVLLTFINSLLDRLGDWHL